MESDIQTVNTEQSVETYPQKEILDPEVKKIITQILQKEKRQLAQDIINSVILENQNKTYLLQLLLGKHPVKKELTSWLNKDHPEKDQNTNNKKISQKLHSIKITFINNEKPNYHHQAIEDAKEIISIILKEDDPPTELIVQSIYLLGVLLRDLSERSKERYHTYLKSIIDELIVLAHINLPSFEPRHFANIFSGLANAGFTKKDQKVNGIIIQSVKEATPRLNEFKAQEVNNSLQALSSLGYMKDDNEKISTFIKKAIKTTVSLLEKQLQTDKKIETGYQSPEIFNHREVTILISVIGKIGYDQETHEVKFLKEALNNY